MSRKRIDWYKGLVGPDGPDGQSGQGLDPAHAAPAPAPEPDAARAAGPRAGSASAGAVPAPEPQGSAPLPAASSGRVLPPLPQRIIPGRPARPLVPGLFSVAPMIDKTSRHFRWFLRQLTRRAVLYTEMVTAPAIIHGRRDILLDFDPVEHPIVLQVGGDDPEQIAQALRIAGDWGYDEYNLNVGCPSDKVQQGRFGACLMADPHRVADIVAAMAAVTDKPVTVKHRVGIQGFGFHRESFEELAEFVRIVAEAGCDRFIVHARIAMLEGLTPRENRSVPPIRYEDAYRLKALWPNLHVELNGQIKTLDDCRTHLSHGMDGLMIGRASYEHPLLMAGLDAFEADWLAGRMGEGGAGRAEEAIGGLAAEGGDRAFRCNSSPDSPPADHPAPGFPLQSLARSGAGAVPELDRRALVLLWADYMDRWKERGLNPRSLVWPILELFPGVPGSRKYRQILSQPYLKEVSVAALARQALAELPGDVR